MVVFPVLVSPIIPQFKAICCVYFDEQIN